MGRKEEALRYAHKVILHEINEGRTPHLIPVKNGGKGFGFIEDAICFREDDELMEIKRRLRKWVFITATLTLVAFVHWSERHHPDVELKQYCEMVKLHKESDGENGWPDYKKQYDKICPN